MKISNQGVTLVEAIVVAGILLILALAMSQMMVNQAQQQKSANAKTTFNALVNSTQSAVNSGSILRNSADAQQ